MREGSEVSGMRANEGEGGGREGPERGTKKSSCSRPMLACRPFTLKPRRFSRRAPSLDIASDARSRGVFSSSCNHHGKMLIIIPF